MAPKKKRVRDFSYTIDVLPKWRDELIARGSTPHVLCDKNGAYWNGLSVIDIDRISPLRGVKLKQMINMMLDGEFGEEVKDAIIDDNRYWKIRDDLLEYPNPEVIARDGLRVLDTKRLPAEAAKSDFDAQKRFVRTKPLRSVLGGEWLKRSPRPRARNRAIPRCDRCYSASMDSKMVSIKTDETLCLACWGHRVGLELYRKATGKTTLPKAPREYRLSDGSRPTEFGWAGWKPYKQP